MKIQRSIFFSAILFCHISTASAATMQDFISTCSSPHLNRYTGSQQSLDTVCEAENGGKYNTKIELRGILVKNGKLTFDSNSPISDFAMTCGTMSIDDEGTIGGLCRNSSGGMTWSFLNIRHHLRNYNGTLVYVLPTDVL